MTFWVICDCTPQRGEVTGQAQELGLGTALPHHALPRTGLFTFKGLAKIKSHDPASLPTRGGLLSQGPGFLCELSSI